MNILAFLLIAFSPVFLTFRKQSTGGNRLLDFDYTNCLRGVAILLIMVGHIACTLGDVRWITPFGSIGVALFLFLSGFGCNESYKRKGLESFWQKRVKRVLLPYAIVITIVYVCLQKWDLVSWSLEITGLRTSFWFIAFMVKWYIAFWVTTRFLQHYRMTAMGLLAIAALFLLPNIEAEQAMSFLLGVICSEKIQVVKRFSKRELAAIAVVGLVTGVAFLALKQMPAVRQYEGEWIYSVVQLMIKLPSAVGLVAALSFVPILMKSRYLMLAGVISYELFLVHFPLYTYLDGQLLWAVALFIGSFIVAYGFNKLNVKISKLI